ncbi:hypothetical protein GCM10011609_85570 [Lentzea pudingi]|uniref:Uncharacterized protein n=1 Tax=Lentzea pudingi TaxID=1789439 RepID=A0ABQ2ISB2_9PSEU|nr:hypothetical protein GCM10011609_85570 [Lentzea pudingi]
MFRKPERLRSESGGEQIEMETGEERGQADDPHDAHSAVSLADRRAQASNRSTALTIHAFI